MPASEVTIELLRHTLATLAYRSAKTLRGAPPEFANYRVAPGSRSPIEILAHLGDLFDWALGLAEGRHEWHNATPLEWDREVARYFDALGAFDKRLEAGVAPGVELGRLFQGPVADALTHTGQLAMLRHLAGCKMRGENYYKADIVSGRVGFDQAAPKLEFD